MRDDVRMVSFLLGKVIGFIIFAIVMLIGTNTLLHRPWPSFFYRDRNVALLRLREAKSKLLNLSINNVRIRLIILMLPFAVALLISDIYNHLQYGTWHRFNVYYSLGKSLIVLIAGSVVSIPMGRVAKIGLLEKLEKRIQTTKGSTRNEQADLLS